ncbi:hypothetical protein [Hymenobacter sp. UYCo722]|uniref:hypothetical protein n=1 Tax=Hymenobacter sp. UYCo722 TaxID=3156335 RepID=UPI003398D4DA
MPVSAQPSGPVQRGWRTGLRTALAVACVAAFIGLTWVRAESLATMMPGVLNLGLGVLTGLLGNSLGYWVGALGVGPDRACVVSQALKLAQIVGVPAGYLLLGGHMPALPLLGAALALAGIVWAHRRGMSCTSRRAA